MSAAARARRARKRWLIAGGLLLLIAAIAAGHWLLALLVPAALYLIHELWLADHIFYSPRSDYRYQLRGRRPALRWEAGALSLERPGELAADTLLLEVVVDCGRLGRLVDPWVEMDDGRRVRRQYFERGVGGRRYVNLSAYAEQLALGGELALRGGHCSLRVADASLWAWDYGHLTGLPTLLLAPHPDDAEIAAFGLYSGHTDCTIATVSAGETEVAQFLPWLEPGEDERDASRFKGEVRSHDSVAAAIWGGLSQERCIALGYGCLQLEAMRRRPAASEPSPWSGLEDTRPFRRFNRVDLPSDGDGKPSWQNLVADLAAVIHHCRPEVLVAPHPRLDKHPDHVSATRALWEAVAAAGVEPRWLLYANHLHASQDFPFGPVHSELGLPPSIDEEIAVHGVLSVGVDRQTQRRKALALDLMHDLKRPLRPRKWLRKRCQRLLGRPLSPYGEDDFLRKAVRASELFVVADHVQMAQLLDEV